MYFKNGQVIAMLLFSIVIPVYNKREYLDECVNSILRQNNDDLEIILVDDGSTDGSKEVCDRLANSYQNIIKVIHKQNEGLLMARRDGFEICSGKYILSLDSDDYFFDGALDKLRLCIKENQPDLIIYDLTLVRENKIIGHLNKTIPFCDNQRVDKAFLFDGMLLKSNNFVSMAAKCIKRTTLDIDNKYREYFGLNYGEDSLQSVAIFNRAENIFFLGGEIYAYRLGSGMTSDTKIKFYYDFKKVYELLGNQKNIWNINAFEEKAAFYLLKTASDYVVAQRYTRYGFKELSRNFEVIQKDTEFLSSYKKLRHKELFGLLRKPEKIIIDNLYHGNKVALYLSIIVMRILVSK